ncbi:hypothetical protein GX563_12225 [Candidatus Bathyarchaeota archaeon]|nr:hypothetical protein [Candidatus Bathyarchaeota archaeon]
MQIEKKLILCSILAIAIGIATVAPLAYFMSNMPTAKAETDNNVPWFNVNIPFAYYEATSKNTSTYLAGLGTIDDVIRYTTSNSIGLNYSVNPSAEGSFENARADYFQLQIYSDLGQIANETTYYGANFGDDADYMKSFIFSRENWFNSSELSCGGGGFITKFNGSLADVLADGGPCGTGGSSSSGCFANTTLPQEFLNAQNAQTIYIDVRRIGSVIFSANSTTVILADNSIVIEHVELTKVGDRFIFGEVPADRMQMPVQIPEPKP